MTFRFKNKQSLIDLFQEIFTQNPYFFKSNVDDPFIVDAGSNIGDSLLYFKYLYPKATVMCFEPHPEAFELLKINAGANNFHNVELHQVALGGKDGHLTLYSDSSSTYRTSGGDKSLLKAVVRREKINLKKPLTVPIKKLSQFNSIKNCIRIDLLKLDVEGEETSVLADLDSEGLLEKTTKVILEYHFSFGKKTSNSLDKIISLLHQNNFVFGAFNYYRYTSNNLHDLTLMLVANKSA
ncbi:MAG TPA: FkbM family methyltransferase [Candidatus Andersenbacteria bacterium]|nr:FkbM family methyltransferase [Candidatus Andersenbacteria bacterium]